MVRGFGLGGKAWIEGGCCLERFIPCQSLSQLGNAFLEGLHTFANSLQEILPISVAPIIGDGNLVKMLGTYANASYLFHH